MNPIGDYIAVYAQMQKDAQEQAVEVQQWTSICMKADVPYTMTVADFERLHREADHDVNLV